MSSTTTATTTSLPPGPEGHPLLGNLPDLARDPLDFVRTSAKNHGDVVRLRLGPGAPLTYLLTNPAHIEYVLLKTHRLFVKARARRRELDTLGRGLLTSEGDLWRRQRRLMQPAFHRRRVAALAGTMVDCTTRTLESWEDGQLRDLHRDMVRLTIDIVAKTLFAVDLTESQIQNLRISAEAVVDHHDPARLGRKRRSYPLHYLPGWVPTPANLRYRRAQRRIHKVVREIIAKRRETEPADDLLGMLLASRDEAGDPLSTQQLIDEVTTLFAAGHETTAGALSWTWYLLSNHEEAEARLLDELATVLEGGRTPDAHDLPHLSYAGPVIKESLRLYPTNWITRRQATEDCEIGGYYVPQGTQLIVCQWAVHRDERFFDHPEAFDPDRWLDGRTEKLPKYAYFPFSGGPRQCIGKSFALMEATLLLATIARRFRPEVLGTVHPRAGITLRPEGGVPATIRARRTISAKTRAKGDLAHA